MVRLALALLLAVAAPAAAQPRALALSPANTSIGFSIGALGLFTLKGQFTRFAGELRFDPAAPAATQVAVLVDTTSVEAEGGGAATARSLDLLRTAEFPTMAYRSTAVALAPDGTATLVGQLTLAGVTRPLALGVRREATRFAATGVLERGAHGLSALRPILADRVRLAITIALDRG
jgi:polyisoprenoid-binding protein YceI